MSTIQDVLLFVVLNHRDLYPREDTRGIIQYPHTGAKQDLTRLWRSTRGLMDQLCKETGSKDEEALAAHLEHQLSKRAEMQFTMVRDHARMVLKG